MIADSTVAASTIALTIQGAEDAEALLTTLRSIAGLTSYSPERFAVTAVGASPIPAERLPIPAAFAATEAEAGTDAASATSPSLVYVEHVPAGTTFAADSFDRFFADATAGELSPVYVHREGGYGYRLNRVVGGDAAPVTLDDPTRFWAGSTPSLISSDVLRALPVELRTGGEPQLRFAEALAAGGGFAVLGGSVTSPRPHEDALYGEQRLFTADWYLGFLSAWVPLLERVAQDRGAVPPYLQRLFLYLAQIRVQVNVDRHDKNALDPAQLAQFRALLARGLAFVDDGEIVGAAQKPLNYRRSMVAYLLAAKHGDALAPEIRLVGTGASRDVVVSVSGHEVERLSKVTVGIDAMDDAEGEIVIRGALQSIYLRARVSLVARVGSTEIPLPDSGIFSEFSVFGEVAQRQPTFTARIPRALIEQADRVEFVAELVEESAPVPEPIEGSAPIPERVEGSERRPVRVRLPLNFRRPTAKLSQVPGSYWVALGRILRAQPDHLVVSRAGFAQRLTAELRLQRRLLAGGGVGRSAAILRLIYFATRPWYRLRRDWIYYDRVVLAGDNGEYAYDYASAQKDGIRKNYVLAADSAAAERFRSEGKRFLAHRTLTHRLRYLNAELVFATHRKPTTRNAFQWTEAYFRDLFDYRLIFINHGLVLDDLSYSLNTHMENASRMCVVSRFETENLVHPSYGFRREQIVETGFARYDGLVSRPTRQLLLAPTWRYYLNKPQDGERLQGHNEEFTDSDYFRVYNGLITNPRLLEALEQHDYTLTYLLHPNTSSHEADYRAVSERVRILAPQKSPGYETMLSESDLMITDFSGVQFDFAYMDKPVLYYHHPSIPPHYQRGSFSYEEHGFGEVAVDEETLVDTLIGYLAQECRMPEDYRARVERFFAHHDQQNSRRIYEAGLDLLASTGRRS